VLPPLCVGLPNHGRYLGDRPWRALLDHATAVERAGLHGVAVVDHVVMSDRIERYPYGTFPGEVDDPWLEPLATLAAISSVTQRIRLTTAVLISPLRPAALLAKTSATLDALSGGRLELGVGTGWQREEYEAIGLDWADRHQVLDDQLAACHALWAAGPVDFTSRTVRLRGVHSSPRPASGSIPIWIGGRLTDRNLARIVRWGSGWMPSPDAGPERIAAGVCRLRKALRDAGRDRSSVRVRAALRPIRDQRGRVDLVASMDGVDRLVSAGGTDLFVPLEPWCTDPADAGEFLERLGQAYRALAQHH
jgi:probable F420-dependent oxidoreductase